MQASGALLKSLYFVSPFTIDWINKWKSIAEILFSNFSSCCVYEFDFSRASIIHINLWFQFPPRWGIVIVD